MAEKEYIEREAFLADKKWLYCTDCEKRKGKKRGKMVTLYEIGEAPCKSCGIHDMLEEVEAYPAADVRPVVRGKWNRTDAYPHRLYCSVCYKTYLKNDELLERWEFPLNFCPNCGAKMEES